MPFVNPGFSGLSSKVWDVEICQRLFIIIAKMVVNRKLLYVFILNVP